jgi:predicted nucleic acid-binding protein
LGCQCFGPTLRSAGRQRFSQSGVTVQVYYGLVGLSGRGEVEVTSAFARLFRNREIDQQDLRLAMTRLTELRRRWIEVQPTGVLRDLAEALLQRHPLRAADALQLAAALVWAKQFPRKRLFVCFDGRLAEAAGKEGFTVETL